jgi:hypothetical protein
MSIFSRIWNSSEADDEMARASARPLDIEKIDALVDQLKQSVRDAEMFKSVVTSIDDDKSLSSAEIIEISRRFVGGTKAKSRKAAITALGQERLRLSHARAKAATAAKSRTW